MQGAPITFPESDDWPVDLLAGETELWRGRPDTALRIGANMLAPTIFTAALLLGCLGIATVVDRSVPGVFWTILGPGLVISAGILTAPLLIDQNERRRTRYRITTKRVQIMRGITVESLPFPPPEQLTLSDHAPKTITLGHDRRNRPITLERLHDADAAYAVLTAEAARIHAA